MVLPRTLLYVSPVVPADTGNGLAMRSRMVLDLLARRYDVSLLVVPLHGRLDARLSAAVAVMCRHVEVLPPPDVAQGPSAFLAALDITWPAAGQDHPATHGWPLLDQPFDVVHAFRLTALPYALPYLFGPGRTPARHLDLDEVESATRRRLAGLFRATGQEMAARFADLEAKRCRALEHEILDRFDRIYVSSAAEFDALAPGGHRAKVTVVPNVIGEPVGLDGPRPEGPFRFLFVGTLGFPANEDAVVHFCRDILPRLRLTAPRPFEFAIVGAGATSRIRALAEASDVRLIGAVPDVTPWYWSADAVVVPLRAGGGTRLKVLEAMSHRRPVVSTPAGVEGLDVQSERHALVAEAPDLFADHCRRLMTSRELRVHLARHALDLVRSAHTPEAAAAALFA